MVHIGLLEPLQGQPYPGLRMMFRQRGGHFLEEGYQIFAMVLAGVAAGDEDGVEPFAGFVKRILLGQEFLLALWVWQLDLNGHPDPVVQIILFAQVGKAQVHLVAGQLEVGRRVVVLEGDIFDAVGSEDRQLAEVLVELGDSPGIPTVSPGPIPNLMAADWHIRTCLRGKCGPQTHPPFAQLQGTQQMTHSKQNAATIPALNCHDGAFAIFGGNADGEAFGLGRRLGASDFVGPRVIGLGHGERDSWGIFRWPLAGSF